MMHSQMRKDSDRLHLFRCLLDVLVLATAAQAVSLYHFKAFLTDTAPIHDVLLYICCALAFYVFSKFDLYASWRGRSMLAMFGQIAMLWGIVLFIGLVFSFLVHRAASVSRFWLCGWYVVGIIFLVVYRAIVFGVLRWIRRHGWNLKRVVIVGYSRTGQEVHRRACYQDWYGYDVKAIHCDPEEEKHIKDDGIFRVRRLEDIHDYVMANQIDEIWITLPMNAVGKLQDLQYLLRNTLADIRWMPDTPSVQMLSRKTVDFLGMLTVDLNSPGTRGLRGIIKDLFDKVFAAAVLIFLAPGFVLIAICIKRSSSGPVFFKQLRHGLNGKQFYIYKFRTMKLHHEDSIVTQATKDDPRITRFGKFLRRTSIDELPQFINVLKGDMSVVGPRPHAVQHNQLYEDAVQFYMQRHRVKPGITGWAQINGLRGETDTVEKMSRRAELDLHYIQNWSLRLDLRILIWTAFKGWTGSHVY